MNNSEIDEIINITDETLSAPKKGIILTIPQVEVKTEMKTGLNTSVEIQQVIEQKLPENKLDLLKMVGF